MRSGFTLIEVLVGLAVAALALTAGVAAMAIVQDRSVHATEASTGALAGSATRGLLADWISGARSESLDERPFQGLDSDEQGTDSDELHFPTTARTPLGTTVTMVRLYIDQVDSTAERGLVAELTERLIDQPQRFELVPQATSLEVRYWPRVAEATEWLPSWIDQNGLPAAVEITLETARSDTLPPLLRFPLRVALEAVR